MLFCMAYDIEASCYFGVYRYHVDFTHIIIKPWCGLQAKAICAKLYSDLGSRLIRFRLERLCSEPKVIKTRF